MPDLFRWLVVASLVTALSGGPSVFADDDALPVASPAIPIVNGPQGENQRNEGVGGLALAPAMTAGQRCRAAISYLKMPLATAVVGVAVLGLYLDRLNQERLRGQEAKRQWQHDSLNRLVHANGDQLERVIKTDAYKPTVIFSTEEKVVQDQLAARWAGYSPAAIDRELSDMLRTGESFLSDSDLQSAAQRLSPLASPRGRYELLLRYSLDPNRSEEWAKALGKETFRPAENDVDLRRRTLLALVDRANALSGPERISMYSRAIAYLREGKVENEYVPKGLADRLATRLEASQDADERGALLSTLAALKGTEPELVIERAIARELVRPADDPLAMKMTAVKLLTLRLRDVYDFNGKITRHATPSEARLIYFALDQDERELREPIADRLALIEPRVAVPMILELFSKHGPLFDEIDYGGYNSVAWAILTYLGDAEPTPEEIKGIRGVVAAFPQTLRDFGDGVTISHKLSLLEARRWLTKGTPEQEAQAVRTYLRGLPNERDHQKLSDKDKKHILDLMRTSKEARRVAAEEGEFYFERDYRRDLYVAIAREELKVPLEDPKRAAYRAVDQLLQLNQYEAKVTGPVAEVTALAMRDGDLKARCAAVRLAGKSTEPALQRALVDRALSFERSRWESGGEEVAAMLQAVASLTYEPTSREAYLADLKKIVDKLPDLRNGNLELDVRYDVRTSYEQLIRTTGKGDDRYR